MGRNGLGGSGRGTTPSDSTSYDGVFVVATSPINRIVITRMVERIYLKAMAITPETALDALRAKRPMMVIIDEGRQPDLIEPLIEEIARLRSAFTARLPRIVLIVEASRQNEARRDGIVDAVVVKPITPEVLQPIVDRLSKGAAI
ncbi:response regulator [Chelativorans sp. AA-79]|uniref:response regulator n=1 Tax=Chelativorans sp. AA-79 TaxID=3028735 RepID=UPI0023F98973|nr:response regulator [Chelativorans sp. AA-79]WEX08820.1 response regulator [Chelativorans sp. AA-79]